jgi:hypothetical protein
VSELKTARSLLAHICGMECVGLGVFVPSDNTLCALPPLHAAVGIE